MRYLVLISALLFAAPASAGLWSPGMPLNPAIQKAQQERAQAVACYNVGDSDARSYCLARAHREPGQCYNIRRDDMRSMCLAEVRR